MRAVPYLFFSGNCEEALNAYAKALNGTLKQVVRYDSMPEHAPPGWGSKVMHASLSANGAEIMGSDAPPEHYQKPQGVSVSLHVEEPAEGERIFKALSEGGAVMVPFGPTEWARGFAMFNDKFGIAWMINCE
jgi:PhnB protein